MYLYYAQADAVLLHLLEHVAILTTTLVETLVKKRLVVNMIYTTEDFSTASFLWGEYSAGDVKVHNPIIIPPVRVPCEKTYVGGMVNEDLNEVNAARMWRERGQSKPPLNVLSLRNSNITAHKSKQGDYVYLGVLYDQYGHFLLESLSRIPLVKEERSPAIHLNLYPKSFEHINYSLKALGIKSTSIEHRTRIDGIVTVPRPRVIIGSYFDTSQVRIYEEIRNYALNRTEHKNLHYPELLYISRSRVLQNARRIANEVEIEKGLVKLGFTICHMQDIPFEEQILLMYHAKVVVGFTGSAMHSILFTTEHTRAIFLYKDPDINKNYIACDKMLGRSSTYVNISSMFENNRVNVRKLVNTLYDII